MEKAEAENAEVAGDDDEEEEEEEGEEDDDDEKGDDDLENGVDSENENQEQ